MGISAKKPVFFGGFLGITHEKIIFKKNRKNLSEPLAIAYYGKNFRKIGPAVLEITAWLTHWLTDSLDRIYSLYCFVPCIQTINYLKQNKKFEKQIFISLGKWSNWHETDLLLNLPPMRGYCQQQFVECIVWMQGTKQYKL